jgi:glycosyltransferase involved in cell wall biosynthesis
MKILFVAHDGADGIGTHSAGLQAALPAALGAGDNLVVTALTGRQSRRGARILGQQLRLPFTERDADLVHLPDFRPTLIDPRPTLLTVHDVCVLDHPDWYPRSVYRYKATFLRLVRAKQPAAIVCVSAYTERRLRHHLPGLRSPISVIHPGIETPELAPPPTGDEEFFLTLSTIEPRKNHLGLLGAFREARRRGLRLRWKVAGASGYKGEPIAAALRSVDGVDVLGPVTNVERERLFRSAAFVAVPSSVEGFGIPAGEAMARGIPVIVATGSGLDEVGAGAGLRLDPGDGHAWADALLQLQDDIGLRGELRRQGIEAAAGMSWSEAAESYVALYRSLVA